MSTRLKRYSPLKRSPLPPRRTWLDRNKTRIRPVRSKPRRGQPTPAEKKRIRLDTYQLTGGRCMLRYEGCKGGILPLEGSVFNRWHLVHLRAKRRFGWGPENVSGGCYHCHIEVRHQKGVPKNEPESEKS